MYSLPGGLVQFFFLNNLSLISAIEFIGFQFWISIPLDLFLLLLLYFSKKWLCLGFHSWRAILGLKCFHLFYFKITKPFLVIVGFAIHSSLCFTKTIKPTLSKNAVLSKMDSVLLGEQERTEPACVINNSREIAAFPEPALVRGCWPLVRSQWGHWLWAILDPDSGGHVGICPHRGHILCTLSLAPSPLLLWAPAVIFEGSEPLKTKAGFLNEHF